jgi:hypothetical protein
LGNLLENGFVPFTPTYQVASNRGVRQGDPLSPYLFILVTEILAASIIQNEKIEGINIGHSNIKVLQYADDTNGALKNEKSLKHFL